VGNGSDRVKLGKRKQGQNYAKKRASTTTNFWNTSATVNWRRKKKGKRKFKKKTGDLFDTLSGQRDAKESWKEIFQKGRAARAEFSGAIKPQWETSVETKGIRVTWKIKAHHGTFFTALRTPSLKGGREAEI